MPEASSYGCHQDLYSVSLDLICSVKVLFRLSYRFGFNDPVLCFPRRYYSLHGHVETMAREVLRGANEVPDVEATLWQIPETLPEKILEKVQAAPRPDDVPEIQGEQLGEADGFMFGFPSRFGVMASQVMTFFDNTSDLWTSQALAGKPAGIFWSTGFHGGGQELTA